MKTCTICNEKLVNDSYCEVCTSIIGVLYTKYSTQQIMAIFSNVIGVKITQELTNTMYNTLKDKYEAEKLKAEDKLN